MNTLTREWLDCFNGRKSEGLKPADSIFWRLAVAVLPVGVDGDDPEVQAAIEEIKASIQDRNHGST